MLLSKKGSLLFLGGIAACVLSLFFLTPAPPSGLVRDGHFGVRDEREAFSSVGNSKKKILFLNAGPGGVLDQESRERVHSLVSQRGFSRTWIFYGGGNLSLLRLAHLYPTLLKESRAQQVILYLDARTILNDYLYYKSRGAPAGLRDLVYEWSKLRAFSAKEINAQLYRELHQTYLQQILAIQQITQSAGASLFILTNGANKQDFGAANTYRLFGLTSALLNRVLPPLPMDLAYLGLAATHSRVDFSIDKSLEEMQKSGAGTLFVDLLVARIMPRIERH